MRRREFIAGLAGAAAMPLAARAQPKQSAVIGFLGANTAAVQRHATAALVQRLQELGWIEGRNLVIEYRWADGRYDRSPGLVAELIARKVDVIVTHAPPNVVAAKNATSDVPIVFAAVGDPVTIGVVASLARPAATQQACPCRRPIWPANGSKCCVRLCRICAGWLFWAMPEVRIT